MAKKNLSGMAVVSVSQMAGETVKPESRTGLFPVIMTPIAGQIPSLRVLSGSIAQNMLLVPGRSYLVTFMQDEDQEFKTREGLLVKGAQFNWANAGAVSPMEVIAMRKELGAAGLIEVDEPTLVVLEPKKTETVSTDAANAPVIAPVGADAGIK